MEQSLRLLFLSDKINYFRGKYTESIKQYKWLLTTSLSCQFSANCLFLVQLLQGSGKVVSMSKETQESGKKTKEIGINVEKNKNSGILARAKTFPNVE